MMNVNVYGLIGIKAIDSNWNAGFDKYPKSLSDGTIIGSDKALKYAFRNYWVNMGEKVLYFKSYKTSTKENKKSECLIQPLTLAERYERVFGTPIVEKTSNKEVLENILSAIDCRQFGFTFAESKQNLNQAGVVQIGIGRNICDDTNIEVQDILSPFLNPNKKEDGQKSSLGDFVTADKVNYCYPFSINPSQINWKDVSENIKEYDETDYENFVKAAAVCANALNTCTKRGCSNEYLILVEAKDDKLFLNNLAEYVSLKDNDLNIEKLIDYLSYFKERIASIKVYYDRESINIGDYDIIEKHDIRELQ